MIASTPEHQLECLDTSRLAEREAYERAFYEGFRRAAGNRLIRPWWQWDDDAGRLATRIPYEEQIIFVLRDDASGAIRVAMAVYHALRSFQSAAYGFPPPAEPRGCCELLTGFSAREPRLPTTLLFWRSSFGALCFRGYHTAYATTAPRVLGFYLRTGARVIGEREIDGETRYFLEFDLSHREWRGGRDQRTRRRAPAAP
jgi:hypothetical protein